MSMFDLSELCPVDGRPIGEHTMTEWADHLESPDFTTDAPFTPVAPEDVTATIGFGDDDVPMYDTMTVRGGVADVDSPFVTGKIPVIVFDFTTGGSEAAPLRFAFVSTPDIMRATGRLVRDTANAAANAAER